MQGIILFYGTEHENQQLGSGFVVHHRILLENERRMFYIVQRVRWCNIIVLNACKSSKGKRDDSKVFL